MSERINNIWGQRVRHLRFTARFLLDRALSKPIEIPDKPWLPDTAVSKIAEFAGSDHLFLEYGSGGSTILASELFPSVVTVDSDKPFLEAVTQKIKSTDCDFHPIHVDLGLTREFGAPLFTLKTSKRLARWRKYPIAPWDRLAQLNAVPDLILVDGRFRVACVLESMLRLTSNASTIFLLDDFSERNYYWHIKEFSGPVSLIGRVAMFKKSKDFDVAKCELALRTNFYSDWR